MPGEYDTETPSLRVNVYQDGRLVAQLLCESADEAADAIAQWDDLEGIEYDMEDLAATHDASDVRASETEDLIPESEYRA
jgi:hypothetical protein